MPPKKANGYKLPAPLPKGEVLEDRAKQKWKLGESIGKGGFGEIYSAKPVDMPGTNYPNVIKIEPFENGPLFVEMHFYLRNAKPEDVKQFAKDKNLTTFGMPYYFGSGSHVHKDEKYRFLVMEKFGSDIWKYFLENNRQFPEATVFQLGVQILDVLEYIHEKGYVHADIKGANILMGITAETINKQVYLVDFGLAGKYSSEKEFKPNPKKAHDGTLEYLSRDAHHGVLTRRGDLEILIYNLIQWLGGTLPWIGQTSPIGVHKMKNEHMESIAKLTKASFGNKRVPEAIKSYLTYLKTLEFNSEPDYAKLREILEKGVKDAGGTMGSELKFAESKTPSKRKSAAKLAVPNKKQKTNDEDPDDSPPGTPKNRRNRNVRGGSVPPVSNLEKSKPEKKVKKRGRPGKEEKENVLEEDSDKDPYAGYTDAMKEMAKKIQENTKAKKPARQRRATVESDNLSKRKPTNNKTETASVASSSRGTARSRRLLASPPNYIEENSDSD